MLGRRFSLFVFLGVAWLIYNMPYVHIPFKWFETYFHELSHGIAALLTSGSVDRLELNFDGSGTIWFSGSVLPVIGILWVCRGFYMGGGYLSDGIQFKKIFNNVFCSHSSDDSHYRNYVDQGFSVGNGGPDHFFCAYSL